MGQVPKQGVRSEQQPRSRRDRLLGMWGQRSRVLPDAGNQGDHIQSLDATADCDVACCRVFTKVYIVE